MTTIATSSRVGQTLTAADGHTLTIVGDHTLAKMLKLESERGCYGWMLYAEAEKLLKPAKARPGNYCRKPCCAKRRAPRTC